MSEEMPVCALRFLLVIVAALLVSELPVSGQATGCTAGRRRERQEAVRRASLLAVPRAGRAGRRYRRTATGRPRSAWPAFSRYVRRPTEEMVPYTEKMLPDDGARGHLCLAEGDSITARGQQHPATQSLGPVRK